MIDIYLNLPMMIKIYLPVILLLSLLAYSSSLQGDFIWDDVPQIVDNPYIKDLSNAPLYFEKGVWELSRINEQGTPYYRPMFTLSIAIDYKIWGLNPFGYRITNIFLHFIIIIFVYLIADMILKDKTAALIASAVFALHPANTEVVAWIAGRTDMVAGIFLLPAFLLHYKRKYYLSIPLFLFALLSKETSIVFPLLILSYSIIMGKKGIVALKEVIPYIIATILYLFLRSMVFTGGIGLTFTTEKVLLLTKSIIHLFRFIIFPFPVVFLPDDSIPQTLFIDIIGTAGFICIIAFLLKRNRDAAIFSLIWLILTLLPTFAVLFNPRINTFGYRFLYLPLIGYAILMGILFSGILKSFKEKIRLRYIAISILIGVLILYTSITYISGFKYRSLSSLWGNTLKYFPNSAFTHASFAYGLDSIEMQIKHYEKSIELNPSPDNRYIGLGTAYAKLGNYNLAKEYIEKGIKYATTKAGMSMGYNSLGNIYYLEKRVSDAKEMYEKAIEVDNLNAEAYYNLAIALESTGRHEDAVVYRKRHEALTSNDITK